MTIIINPGSGPVEPGSLENATTNIAQFIEDLELGMPTAFERGVGSDSDGRHSFTLTTGLGSCEVDMPGLPVDQVRPGIPWEQPRLYVDGSSWLWSFAVNNARRALLGEGDE